MRRVAALACLLVMLAVGAEAVEYRIHDLGTLGGNISFAYGMNNHGQVVGASETADGSWHAFVWQDGKMTDFVTFNKSSARAINDSGQVAGTVTDETGDSCGFLWPTRLEDTVLIYFDGSQAYDINAVGSVAGSMLTANGMCGMIISDTVTQIGNFGGTFSAASAINDIGEVVGYADPVDGYDHAFLWSDDELIDLGTLGGRMSAAYDINNSSQVVGLSYVSRTSKHAFLWENGVMQDLGTLGGWDSEAQSINNSGQVVGRSQCPNSSIQHAFIWQNGEMIDINPPDAFESRADCINDNGWICGYAIMPGSSAHAVLWEPVPEPSSILVLLSGLGGVGLVLRRRAGRG